MLAPSDLMRSEGLIGKHTTRPQSLWLRGPGGHFWLLRPGGHFWLLRP
jgi:hypothetical protein